MTHVSLVLVILAAIAMFIVFVLWASARARRGGSTHAGDSGTFAPNDGHHHHHGHHGGHHDGGGGGHHGGDGGGGGHSGD